MRWRMSASSGAAITVMSKSEKYSATLRILLAARFSMEGSAATRITIWPRPRTLRSESRQRGSSPLQESVVVWSYVAVTDPTSVLRRADI